MIRIILVVPNNLKGVVKVKKLWILAVTLLAVGLVTLPLIAQEVSPAKTEKNFKLGVGLKLSGINYLIASTQVKKGELNLYFSAGFAGYPRGEYPYYGMVWAFPLEVTVWFDQIKILEETLGWGIGIGVNLLYLSSPELPPGITVSLVNFSILAFQSIWEKKIDKYSIFLKGGPVVPLGPGGIGFQIEGGLWIF